MHQTTLFSLNLDMVLKVSTNQIYSGVHYRRRMKHKKLYQWEVLRAIREQNISPVHSYPVVLIFYFYFSKNQLDSSNCSYMGKLIEDALVKHEIFTDDRPVYVKAPYYESRKTNKGEKDKIVLEVINGEIFDHKPDSGPVQQVIKSKYSRKDSQQELFQ